MKGAVLPRLEGIAAGEAARGERVRVGSEAMKEYQKHIKHTHLDHAGKAICGITLEPFDWAFENIDHAFLAIPTSRLQVCPDCKKTVIDTFNSSE